VHILRPFLFTCRSRVAITPVALTVRVLFLLLLLFTIPLATAAPQQNLTALVKIRPELSNLSTYFDLHPGIVESVLRWPNRTFLAPNDEAFAKAAPLQNAFAPSFNIIDVKDTSIGALFEYHTLVPFIRSTDILNGPPIIPTTLVDPTYTALSRGQVVVASGIRGQQPIVTSGLQSISTIVVPVSRMACLHLTCTEYPYRIWNARGALFIS
jgi:hypothetical protein